MSTRVNDDWEVYERDCGGWHARYLKPFKSTGRHYVIHKDTRDEAVEFCESPPPMLMSMLRDATQ